MVQLRETLNKAHKVLKAASIDHALIGGLALATLGVNRSTADVDLMIDGKDREKAKTELQKAGFDLRNETPEVMQFNGIGFLDILLANRPMSKAMLENAQVLPPFQIKCLGPEDIIGLKIQAYINNPKREFQDKADISSLFEMHKNMDLKKIKQYADIFKQWPIIEDIKNKICK